MSKSDLQCSFCGKKKDQTSLLIAGIDAHICDLCIEQANEIGITINELISPSTLFFLGIYAIIFLLINKRVIDKSIKDLT